jgi:membrane associated rhomboid family serine protease
VAQTGRKPEAAELAQAPASGRSDGRSLRKKSHRTRPTEKPVKSAPAATLVLAVNRFSLPIRLPSRSRAIPVHRPDSLLALIFLYDRWALNYRTHLGTRKEHPLALTPQQRWKLDRFRKQVTGFFGRGEQQQPRPKLCPACGTLVGAGATRCHQCGASMTFSVAAASKSLGRLLPATSPATYGILGLSCLFYVISLLWTMRLSGLQQPSGGPLGILNNLGAINGEVLQRLGASIPLAYDLQEPWRLVMAVFLHGSLLHIGFNMWVLMDIGPQIEELYGSARYFFIYIFTGICGYLVSSYFGHFSVGGSGALLGLIGILLAITTGRRSAGMRMLRQQIIRWLIYILVWGLLFPGIDNMAHLGGLASGFILGRIMMDRPPMTPEERKKAYLLGWAATLVVAASMAMMIYANVHANQDQTVLSVPRVPSMQLSRDSNAVMKT